MKISRIEIRDTLGTSHCAFEPGSATRISGQNGSGKSSILRALAYIFDGGCDFQIIRKGSDRSVVSFELDNGVRVSKTTWRVQQRGKSEVVKYNSELKITDASGVVIPAPKEFVESLSASLAVDPSTLLRIDTTKEEGRKKLAVELLRLVPIRFTPSEIEAACAFRSSMDVQMGRPDTTALTQPAAEMDLDGLKKLSAAITDTRRSVGRTRDDTDGTINELQASLPADDGKDYSAEISSLEQEGLDIERAISARKLEIERGKSALLAKAKQAAMDASKAADAEYERELARITAIRQEAKRVAQDACQAEISEAMGLASAELKDLEERAKPERDRVTSELATAKERAAAHNRAETLRGEIDRQLAKHRAAAWRYEQLTKVLDSLDRLRTDKLSNLPVEGLVVEGGEAFLDGIPWDKVNLSRRVQAVLQICTQRSGELPLILLDDAEHLDTETRAAIEQGLVDAGFQVMAATVSDGPLNIECLQPAGVA